HHVAGRDAAQQAEQAVAAPDPHVTRDQPAAHHHRVVADRVVVAVLDGDAVAVGGQAGRGQAGHAVALDQHRVHVAAADAVCVALAAGGGHHVVDDVVDDVGVAFGVDP